MAVAEQQNDHFVASEIAQNHMIVRPEFVRQHLAGAGGDTPRDLTMGIDTEGALDLIEAHRIDHEHAQRTGLSELDPDPLDLLADAAERRSGAAHR